MTVTGEAPAAPGVGHDAPAQSPEQEAIFVEAYTKYWRPIRWYIRARLDDRHADYADDLAQETFIRFLRLYVQKEKARREGAYTLLTMQARTLVGIFYDTRFSSERATDFVDPVNTPLVGSQGAYAATTPGLTSLVSELEAAMERMADASKAWRDKHKKCYDLRCRLDGTHATSRLCGLRPEARERYEAEFRLVTSQEEGLLAEFRSACLAVGQLRAELERTAGCRWNASSGGPDSSAPGKKVHGSLSSDPTVTHCREGHLLDKDNTNFSEEGRRTCRLCKTRQAREWWTKRRAMEALPSDEAASVGAGAR